MTTTVTRFRLRARAVQRLHDGERTTTEDLQGLVTEDVTFSCGCQSHREEFHDGSVHRQIVNHRGRVLVDEEFRGE